MTNKNEEEDSGISNRDLLRIAPVFLLIVVMVMLLYLVHTVRNESGQCLLDPFAYGATKLTTANNAYFSGTGTATGKEGFVVHFNPHGTWVQVLERKSNGTSLGGNINWSALEEIVVLD